MSEEQIEHLPNGVLTDEAGYPFAYWDAVCRAQRGVHLAIRAVREAVGKTQVDVASESAIDQSDVSRLEGREDFEDCLVSTLRRYIAALGGDLQLVASFGDKKIILTGSQPGSGACAG